MHLERHPSPNFTERRQGARPDLLVIHYTAMASAEAALSRLCDPAAGVSAHYLIARDGRVFQLVDEDKRAWHAGAAFWAGLRDVNSRSIGIELDNDGTAPFAAPLMDALERLMDGVMHRWSIPAARVIGHSDCAPGRKVDPGPRFDWRRLALGGRAVRPVAQAPSSDADPARWRGAMARAGYDPALDDAVLLEALRLRLRPGATGPLDATDLALAEALAGIDRADRSA